MYNKRKRHSEKVYQIFIFICATISFTYICINWFVVANITFTSHFVPYKHFTLLHLASFSPYQNPSTQQKHSTHTRLTSMPCSLAFATVWESNPAVAVVHSRSNSPAELAESVLRKLSHQSTQRHAVTEDTDVVRVALRCDLVYDTKLW